jgi:hypothetical protein
MSSTPTAPKYDLNGSTKDIWFKKDSILVMRRSTLEDSPSNILNPLEKKKMVRVGVAIAAVPRRL